MKDLRIVQVEGGYMLTGQAVVGNKVIQNAHLFNSLTEAQTYGARFYA